MSDTTETRVDLPYRIQTPGGFRKYLCSGLYMPSVTTVLTATETEKSKASLRIWQQNNPGALEEASTRGSAIHLGCENYLRGLDPGVPEQYSDFWNGITQYLDWFDVLHWSERPLRKDWYHLRSDDKEVAYVWSTEHLFAGCPDLIGEIGETNLKEQNEKLFKETMRGFSIKLSDPKNLEKFGLQAEDVPELDDLVAFGNFFIQLLSGNRDNRSNINNSVFAISRDSLDTTIQNIKDQLEAISQ